uniref:Uncharacterized protein n=1 Tax=Anguilla anguilla TaxID=7936 RepID=A0A0E9XCM6_ANGAN
MLNDKILTKYRNFCVLLLVLPLFSFFSLSG